MAILTEQVSPTIVKDINSLVARGNDAPWYVVLFNCNCHSADEVVLQLLKATDHSAKMCINIMMEAHTHGRAVAYRGNEEMCNRCAIILGSIGLRVEVERK